MRFIWSNDGVDDYVLVLTDDAANALVATVDTFVLAFVHEPRAGEAILIRGFPDRIRLFGSAPSDIKLEKLAGAPSSAQLVVGRLEGGRAVFPTLKTRIGWPSQPSGAIEDDLRAAVRHAGLFSPDEFVAATPLSEDAGVLRLGRSIDLFPNPAIRIASLEIVIDPPDGAWSPRAPSRARKDDVIRATLDKPSSGRLRLRHYDRNRPTVPPEARAFRFQEAIAELAFRAGTGDYVSIEAPDGALEASGIVQRHEGPQQTLPLGGGAFPNRRILLSYDGESVSVVGETPGATNALAVPDDVKDMLPAPTMAREALTGALRALVKTLRRAASGEAFLDRVVRPAMSSNLSGWPGAPLLVLAAFERWRALSATGGDGWKDFVPAGASGAGALQRLVSPLALGLSRGLENHLDVMSVADDVAATWIAAFLGSAPAWAPTRKSLEPEHEAALALLGQTPYGVALARRAHHAGLVLTIDDALGDPRGRLAAIEPFAALFERPRDARATWFAAFRLLELERDATPDAAALRDALRGTARGLTPFPLALVAGDDAPAFLAMWDETAALLKPLEPPVERSPAAIVDALRTSPVWPDALRRRANALDRSSETSRAILATLNARAATRQTVETIRLALIADRMDRAENIGRLAPTGEPRSQRATDALSRVAAHVRTERVADLNDAPNRERRRLALDGRSEEDAKTIAPLIDRALHNVNQGEFQRYETLLATLEPRVDAVRSATETLRKDYNERWASLSEDEVADVDGKLRQIDADIDAFAGDADSLTTLDLGPLVDRVQGLLRVADRKIEDDEELDAVRAELDPFLTSLKDLERQREKIRARIAAL